MTSMFLLRFQSLSVDGNTDRPAMSEGHDMLQPIACLSRAPQVVVV